MRAHFYSDIIYTIYTYEWFQGSVFSVLIISYKMHILNSDQNRRSPSTLAEYIGEKQSIFTCVFNILNFIFKVPDSTVHKHNHEF